MRSVTIYGAAGNCLKQDIPVFLKASSTNIVETIRFITHLKANLRNQNSNVRPILIADNHAAHRSKRTVSHIRQWFQLEFQPAYSSNFNIVETCWALIKRVYMVRLHRMDEELKTRAEFESLVEGSIRDCKMCLACIMRVNYWYIERHGQV